MVLEKVKERVLEYLAVQQLTHSLKRPILCFAGPPGVGKTSLANSIAASLNRHFVRVSLVEFVTNLKFEDTVERMLAQCQVELFKE